MKVEEIDDHRARGSSPSPWDYDDRFKSVAGKEKSYSTQWWRPVCG
jgi:hypothetical protein